MAETQQKPLPDDWQDTDLARCWAVLVEHNRERHLRGEPLHPGWNPPEGSPFRAREDKQ